MKKYLFTITLFTFFSAAIAQDTLRGLVFSAVVDTTSQDTLTSSLSGVAAFLYRNDSLMFDMTFNGLSGDILQAGIYGEGDNELLNLEQYVDRNSVRGIMTGISLGNSTMMELLNGTAYLMINNENSGTGIIMLETDINYGAVLDTDQAGITDTLETIPMGLSTYNLTSDSMMLEINILVNNLTSPITNAHLHYGAPGEDGPPVIPLMPYITGSRFIGIVHLDSIDNRENFLDSLNMGLVYVNVHTENFPTGEIRGQLARHDALAFDSWMSIDQQTDTVNPVTPDSAMGLTHMYTNETMDSLWVHILVDSLSGPITGSHFHMGPPGQSGPVIVPLTDSTMSNMIMVTLSAQDTAFSDEMDFATFLTEVLEGNVFINVHTDLNPGGEIRGQMKAVARMGTIFNLCSNQEVDDPEGAENSQGSGFISMDRNHRTLHYGIAVAELTSTLSGAHFHQAPPGVNGPIIHTLPTDSTVSGYWNDTTFTQGMAELFISGDIYANFHTTINPGGEVRGQVMMNNLCQFPLALNENINSDHNISLYPNPAQSILTIEYQLEKAAKIEIRVFDIIGKEVSLLSLGNKPAGNYREELNASNLQNGLYVYTMYVNGNAVYKSKVIVNR